MDENKCRECKYFIQHYSLFKGRLQQINCGHCTFLRAKTKKPTAQVCKDFEVREESTEEFVTKEYLTKELLKRVLEMDLLPDIN